MKSIIFAVLFCTLLLISVAASADIITLTTSPANLYDLDHDWCYKWGMRNAAAPLIIVESAKLSFDNIRNWDNNPNKLFIHLLDSDGEWHLPFQNYNTVTSFRDTQFGMTDQFAGQGIELVTYTNLSSTAQDITYDFTTSQVATLNQYLQNGNDFALALDPDCHFYNCGVGTNHRIRPGSGTGYDGSDKYG